MIEQPLAHLAADADAPFPPTSTALEHPNGLLAWGGDLSPRRLLNAYRSGIFPWYLEGQPVLWWSPAPRCVLRPEDVYLSRRTRRRYNAGAWRVSADEAFEQVMGNCATRGLGWPPERVPAGAAEERDSWITMDMIEAYCFLHRLGHAHSVEVWSGDVLAGGIYGIAIGRVFFGESMFSSATDASKIALIALCRQLQRWSFALLDCQIGNAHLFRMGAIDIERDEFEALLAVETARGANTPEKARWSQTFQCDNRW